MFFWSTKGCTSGDKCENKHDKLLPHPKVKEGVIRELRAHNMTPRADIDSCVADAST
jgi:hypothetical protein